MPTFKPWDIVKVPFPYTDRPVRERRPALVISRNEDNLLWVLMITSASNRGWTGDVEISDLSQAGLPVASVIRTAKIATIETKETEAIGTLCELDRILVRQVLTTALEDLFHGNI